MKRSEELGFQYTTRVQLPGRLHVALLISQKQLPRRGSCDLQNRRGPRYFAWILSFYSFRQGCFSVPGSIPCSGYIVTVGTRSRMRVIEGGWGVGESNGGIRYIVSDFAFKNEGIVGVLFTFSEGKPSSMNSIVSSLKHWLQP